MNWNEHSNLAITLLSKPLKFLYNNHISIQKERLTRQKFEFDRISQNPIPLPIITSCCFILIMLFISSCLCRCGCILCSWGVYGCVKVTPMDWLHPAVITCFLLTEKMLRPVQHRTLLQRAAPAIKKETPSRVRHDALEEPGLPYIHTSKSYI